MNLRKSSLPVLALLLALSFSLAAEIQAEISNAAVLFLRIAPGSRAAGMGEAFVAIADDATATHWNPAGLGTYPLSSAWIETKIPEHLRPLKAFAPLSTGGTRDYLSYDLWAISGGGLVRFDNKHWYESEVFSTRTDETLEGKLGQYFSVTDEERLAGMVKIVAEVNSRLSYEQVVATGQQIMASLPDTYDRKEEIQGFIDSLVAVYYECRINWRRYADLEKRLADGLRDSVLSNTECDRISVAVERSRRRFLPEDIEVPYNVLLEGEPNCIAAIGKTLLVGSDFGLARFNGTNWKSFTMADGLPSNRVTALKAMEGSVLIGTDSGLAIFSGLNVNPLTAEGGRLPAGDVEAIGGRSLTDLYAVVNQNLYHFSGRRWTATTEYTVLIDDSIEKIADKFSIYDTDEDYERFREKYRTWGGLVVTEVIPVELPVDSLAEALADTVLVDATTLAGDSVMAKVEAKLEEAAAMAVEVPKPPVPGLEGPLVPGDKIMVPAVASLKGRTTAIHVDLEGNIWVGTDFGVFYFDGRRWIAPGYSPHVVAEGETIMSLSYGVDRDSTVAADEIRARLGVLASIPIKAAIPVAADLDSNQAAVASLSDEALAVAQMKDSLTQRLTKLEAYAETRYRPIKDLNDLTEEVEAPLTVGRTIMLKTNPAALPVNRVVSDGDKVWIATAGGLLEYDGIAWSRSSLRGLTRSDIRDVVTMGSEAWICGNDRIVIKARGRSEYSAMHVKWLPQLAEDLYYEFLSVVTNLEGWGAVGGSITYISYGKFIRTTNSPDPVGEFDAFDVAATISYGAPLTPKLKGGLSAKMIYSHLSDQGAGKEVGKGTATGFALDLGLLYQWNRRLTLGMAITNLGPKMSYIDASQSDDLPRNLALGFAYKVLQTDYTTLTLTAEVNKLLVGLNASSEELKQLVLNGGGEFTYANLFSARAGYIYDQEGSIQTPTVGFGIAPLPWAKFDFAYIPSNENVSLANTLRISLKFIP